MKKSFLIFMLLVLVVALVACGGEKTPDVTEPDVTDGGDTPAATTTKAPDKFTVKFVDADQFGNTVISEASIGRGKPARAPIDPSHEGYIFLGWDVEDYSSIAADTTITALYRPADTYSVTFYDADGNAIGSPVTVKEGEAVTAPQAPVVYGKIFNGWDKQVGKVDRAWPDFEQYKNLSVEEIAAKPLEYKVAATYKDSDGIIAYKSSISMELVESKDAEGKKIYVPADEIFTTTATYQSDDDYVYKLGGAEKITICKGTVAVAWDGSFIYAYARVYDPTLLTRGEEYVMTADDAWETDGIELCYSLGVEISKATKRLVRADAWGYRKTSGSATTSAFFKDVECQYAQAAESNTYYAMIKLPAKTEEGVALKAGDICYFSMQINDLRSTEDLTNMYSSGSSGKYDKYRNLVLGEASSSADVTSVSVEKADGSKVDVSVFAAIPYKENISMEFTESKNENGVTVYAPADPIFSSSAAKFPSDEVKSWSKAGANVEQKIYCKGNLSFAWDGEFIYVACDVYDPTLMTRGDEYVVKEVNPSYNDTFELYYSFNKYPEKSTRKIAKVDAFGTKVFAAKNGEKSAYFNEITFTHKISKEANSYYIIYKIPAMTEAGIEMKAGDCVSISSQINDLRSLEDVDNFFCSGGILEYDTLWKFLVLGGK